MSELEFRHELTPDQLSEALSLLENANSKPEQAAANEAEPDRFSAAQDPAQRLKQLNRAALRFCGLAIAAALALTLMSWGESRPVPPSGQRIVYAQLPDELWPPPAKDASHPAPRAPLDISPGGSTRQPSEPTIPDSRPGDANRADAPPTVKDAANVPTAASDAAETATPTATGKAKSRRHESRGQKPGEARRRSRNARVAKIDPGECSVFACFVWQARHVFYEPPRNVTQ